MNKPKKYYSVRLYKASIERKKREQSFRKDSTWIFYFFLCVFLFCLLFVLFVVSESF